LRDNNSLTAEIVQEDWVELNAERIEIRKKKKKKENSPNDVAAPPLCYSLYFKGQKGRERIYERDTKLKEIGVSMR